MQTTQPAATFKLGRTVRKFFLSAFVIFMFVIYAVHERLAGPGPVSAANGLAAAPRPTASAPAVIATTPVLAQASPTDSPPVNSADATGQPATAPAIDTPTEALPSPTAAGQYRDGQFTGPQEDAFYGLVQVQAVIQNGQIADVKFLQYPSDRRTSQYINSIAMPYLTTEAVQAQSANVDIISGATLTSQAFAQSLQAALDSAKP
jgi:uncharacterized protein with FMN-binding domain